LLNYFLDRDFDLDFLDRNFLDRDFDLFWRLDIFFDIFLLPLPPKPKKLANFFPKVCSGGGGGGVEILSLR
jgi:hypothetical protein